MLLHSSKIISWILSEGIFNKHFPVIEFRTSFRYFSFLLWLNSILKSVSHAVVQLPKLNSKIFVQLCAKDLMPAGDTLNAVTSMYCRLGQRWPTTFIVLFVNFSADVEKSRWVRNSPQRKSTLRRVGVSISDGRILDGLKPQDDCERSSLLKLPHDPWLINRHLLQTN